MTWLWLISAAVGAPVVDTVVSDLTVVAGASPSVPAAPRGDLPESAWIVGHGDALSDGTLAQVVVNGRLLGTPTESGSAVALWTVDPETFGLDFKGPVGWSDGGSGVAQLTLVLGYSTGAARERLRIWLPDASHAEACGSGSLDRGAADPASLGPAYLHITTAGVAASGTLAVGNDAFSLEPVDGVASASAARSDGSSSSSAFFATDPSGPLQWSGLDCAWVDTVLQLEPLDRDGDGIVDAEDRCTTVDHDGDGAADASAVRVDCGTTVPLDCDDDDPSVFPGATDVPGDGIDSDCDGDDHCDEDEDGVPSEACGGLDCNDTDASVRPFGSDVPGDGLDGDCDGDDHCDEDADGFEAYACGGLDCNDEDPFMNPDAFDGAGDNIDRDCDGDDSCDEDGDGRIALGCGGADCDDLDASVGLGETEIWYDGVDQDCDGNDADRDGDGFRAVEAGGLDCNDDDPFFSPAAPDFGGDGQDQDCDGVDGDGGVCGCASGSQGPGSLLVLLLGLPALRRRRSQHKLA